MLDNLVVCPSCNQTCNPDTMSKCNTCGGKFCGKAANDCKAICLCSVDGIEGDLYDEQMEPAGEFGNLLAQHLGDPLETGLSDTEKLSMIADRSEAISRFVTRQIEASYR